MAIHPYDKLQAHSECYQFLPTDGEKQHAFYSGQSRLTNLYFDTVDFRFILFLNQGKLAVKLFFNEEQSLNIFKWKKKKDQPQSLS